MIASLLNALRPMRKEDGLMPLGLLALPLVLALILALVLAALHPGPRSNDYYKAQNLKIERQACSQVKSVTTLSTRHYAGDSLEHPIVDVVCINGSAHQLTLTLRWDG